MVLRYKFAPGVPLDEIEQTLHLAIFAAEGIHGAVRVRLEVGYHLDPRTRVCILDASTSVGETVGQIFAGLLSREIGEDAFAVQPLDAGAPVPSGIASEPERVAP